MGRHVGADAVHNIARADLRDQPRPEVERPDDVKKERGEANGAGDAETGHRGAVQEHPEHPRTRLVQRHVAEAPVVVQALLVDVRVACRHQMVSTPWALATPRDDQRKDAPLKQGHGRAHLGHVGHPLQQLLRRDDGDQRQGQPHARSCRVLLLGALHRARDSDDPECAEDEHVRTHHPYGGIPHGLEHGAHGLVPLHDVPPKPELRSGPAASLQEAVALPQGQGVGLEHRHQVHHRVHAQDEDEVDGEDVTLEVQEGVPEGEAHCHEHDLADVGAHPHQEQDGDARRCQVGQQLQGEAALEQRRIEIPLVGVEGAPGLRVAAKRAAALLHRASQCLALQEPLGAIDCEIPAQRDKQEHVGEKCDGRLAKDARHRWVRGVDHVGVDR
mmetsp:Transcript_52200/g.135907  ORF Transcript_52200/g.135907 Transcript_52200/m.135907 type:complete len:387 (+) Transcript_52200:262-1422(+)